jgi:hypothetical protein
MKNQRKITVFRRFRVGLNQLKYDQRKIKVFKRFRGGLNQLKYEKPKENQGF